MLTMFMLSLFVLVCFWVASAIAGPLPDSMRARPKPPTPSKPRGVQVHDAEGRTSSDIDGEHW